MGVIKMNNVMQILNPYSPILYLLIVWSIIWKGIALWHSARNKQLVWYIALLIINTVGVLEIVYLIFFKKEQNDSM
jgi:predicted membrane channel-forming protein YqfA (hemolysin III family)